MVTQPGITYGSSGNGDALRAQLSVAQQQLNNVEPIVRQFLEEAVQEMARDVRTKGVTAGVPNSNGRIDTRKMLRSIGYEIKVNARGRVSASFGYIHNEPEWAIFQEYGTDGGQGNGRGILELLALTNAYVRFNQKIQDAFDNGRILNFNQPGLSSGYRGGRSGDGITD